MNLIDEGQKLLDAVKEDWGSIIPFVCETDPIHHDKNGRTLIWGADGDLIALAEGNLAYGASEDDVARLIVFAVNNLPKMLEIRGAFQKGDATKFDKLIHSLIDPTGEDHGNDKLLDMLNRYVEACKRMELEVEG